MMILPALLALGLLSSADAASSSGCGKQLTLTTRVHNINRREYILKIPDNYDSTKPHHLVLASISEAGI